MQQNKQNNKEELTTNQLLELPENFSELYVLKQLIKPDNTDSSFFVFQNFHERWFNSQINQKLFRILKIYWNEYQTYPTKTILDKIITNDKCKDYSVKLSSLITQIYDINESEYNEKYLRDMLVKFTKERALYFTILDNLDLISKHNDISCCMDKFEEIAKYDLNTDLGIEYFTNIDKHIQHLLQPNLKLSTGFKVIDDVTYGGLPTDDTCLFLFMAKPGLGKSMFMANLAANWCLMNKKVLIITLEMSEHMYSMRMDSIFSNININKLRESSENLKRCINGLKIGIPQAQLQIKEFPTGTCTTMMIKQYCKKLKDTKGFVPDVIIVDYLNIVKPNSRSASSSLYEKGKAVAEELRALSGELHIPVISALQSNRNSRGSGYATDDIDMDNSGESSGIPATADAMFAAYQMEGERDAGKINLKIIKNRLGGFIGKSISFEVNYDTLKLFDWNELDESSDEDNKTNTVIKKDTEELNEVLDNL